MNLRKKKKLRQIVDQGKKVEGLSKEERCYIVKQIEKKMAKESK